MIGLNIRSLNNVYVSKDKISLKPFWTLRNSVTNCFLLLQVQFFQPLFYTQSQIGHLFILRTSHSIIMSLDKISYIIGSPYVTNPSLKNDVVKKVLPFSEEITLILHAPIGTHVILVSSKMTLSAVRISKSSEIFLRKQPK